MKKDKPAGINAFEMHFRRYYLIYIFATLSILALVLIGQAEKYEGFRRELSLSIGTGILTSFLVSLAFVFAGKTTAKIEAIKQRGSFLFDLKALLHSMITYLNFDKTIDSPVDFANFLKIQHRWFHEYYKRTVAKNSSLKETNIRKKQISDFYIAQSAWIKQYFEFDNRWKNCDLNEYEKILLNRIYISFKKTEISIEQKSYKQQFCNYAFFIEWLSRLPDTFPELKNFKLITVSSKDGEINYDFSKFYEKEKFLAGVNSIHETRQKQYIDNYSNKKK